MSVLTHPITRFVARRLLYSVAVLLGVLVVVFALVHLVPGDPVRIALGTRRIHKPACTPIRTNSREGSVSA
jgi:peptide/nickel transport system permease protein